MPIDLDELFAPFEDEECFGTPSREEFDEDAAYEESREHRWEEDPM